MEDFDPAIYVVLGTNEQFDPATDSWASLQPMPTNRESMGATVVGNSIYLVGGFNEVPLSPLRENQEFNLRAYYIHKKN
jgi:hypothetical protein